MIHEIETSRKTALAPLFSSHRHFRTTIDAVLEGQFGSALANSVSCPSVAALVDGPVKVFGGDSGHPDAPELIHRALTGQAHLVWWLPSDQWRELLRTSCTGRQIVVEERPRFGFLPDLLRQDRLQCLAHSCPQGFKIQVIDLSLAKRIEKQTVPGMFSELDFRSPEDFVARGIGVCATADGGRVVCVAYSERLCSASVDIAIGTHPDFRRLGLATAVCATFILNCLERGIRTHWDTPFPMSCQLAEKLGYPAREPYITHLVHDKDWRPPPAAQNE